MSSVEAEVVDEAVAATVPLVVLQTARDRIPVELLALVPTCTNYSHSDGVITDRHDVFDDESSDLSVHLALVDAQPVDTIAFDDASWNKLRSVLMQ